MYQQDVEKETYWTADAFNTAENRKAFTEIMYSPGKKVMMMTGYYAKAYNNGEFEDIWYPDFWKLEKPDLTIPEVMDFIKENRTNRKLVNMNALLRDFTEEEVKYLHSSYHIKGMDWSKTKYGPQKF